jgi:hypothetical protein
MGWDIGLSRDFDAWFRDLDDSEQEAIVAAVEQRLNEVGDDIDAARSVGRVRALSVGTFASCTPTGRKPCRAVYVRPGRAPHPAPCRKWSAVTAGPWRVGDGPWVRPSRSSTEPRGDMHWSAAGHVARSGVIIRRNALTDRDWQADETRAAIATKGAQRGPESGPS